MAKDAVSWWADLQYFRQVFSLEDDWKNNPTLCIELHFYNLSYFEVGAMGWLHRLAVGRLRWTEYSVAEEDGNIGICLVLWSNLLAYSKMGRPTTAGFGVPFIVAEIATIPFDQASLGNSVIGYCFCRLFLYQMMLLLYCFLWSVRLFHHVLLLDSSRHRIAGFVVAMVLLQTRFVTFFLLNIIISIDVRTI